MEAFPIVIDSLFTTGLIVVSAVLFPLVATLVVALRFHVRKTTRVALEGDDWMILISLILCWACSINMWVFAGIVGVNVSKLPFLDTLNDTFKIFFSLVLGTTKIGVLLFYKRIFSVGHFKYYAYTMIGLVSAWTLATVLVSINETKPVSGAWTDFQHTVAIDYNSYGLATGGISMGFDILILFMPLFMVNRLKLDMRKKLGVASVFALGFVVVVASAVRFGLLYQSIYGVVRDPSLFGTLNKAFYFANLEINLLVVAASLPTLRPLFMHDGKGGFFSWISRGSTRIFSRSGRSGKSERLTDDTYGQSARSATGGKLDTGLSSGDVDAERGVALTPWSGLARSTYDSSAHGQSGAYKNDGAGITVTQTMETSFR